MLNSKLTSWLRYYKKLEKIMFTTLILWLVYGYFANTLIITFGFFIQGIIVIYLHKCNYDNILKTKEYDKAYDKNKGILGDIIIYLSFLFLYCWMALGEYPRYSFTNIIFVFLIYMCVYFTIEILFALFLKFILLTTK